MIYRLVYNHNIVKPISQYSVHNEYSLEKVSKSVKQTYHDSLFMRDLAIGLF